jgi:hypothetical protein
MLSQPGTHLPDASPSPFDYQAYRLAMLLNNCWDLGELKTFTVQMKPEEEERYGQYLIDPRTAY